MVLNYISKNIKHLCDKENLAKDTFGKLFGLNRGAISSYIEGKANPKIDTLQKISAKYNILIDDLINKDLSLNGINYKNEIKKVGNDKESSIDKLIVDKVLNKLKPYLDKIELHDAALAEIVIKMGMIEEKVSH